MTTAIAPPPSPAALAARECVFGRSTLLVIEDAAGRHTAVAAITAALDTLSIGWASASSDVFRSTTITPTSPEAGVVVVLPAASIKRASIEADIVVLGADVADTAAERLRTIAATGCHCTRILFAANNFSTQEAAA